MRASWIKATAVNKKNPELYVIGKVWGVLSQEVKMELQDEMGEVEYSKLVDLITVINKEL